MTDGDTSKLESGWVANPLVIDLSWARSDLMGVTCPFCRQVLDWEGLRRYEADRGSAKPGVCPHLEFASTECLPFDENVSQIVERITMLKQSYNLFHKNFVDSFDFEHPFRNSVNYRNQVDEKNAAERIAKFSQEIISNLKDGHHFIRPDGYYHRYLVGGILGLLIKSY